MQRNKIGIGAVVGVLLLSGVLAGVSYGDAARVTDPQVIELVSGDILKEASQGMLTQLRESALDTEGARVGTIRWNCADGADWHCTLVYGLRGSESERGSVVATGIFRGFSGESLAVTGGTGAFASVRGVVVLTVVDGGFVHTLDLTP